MESYSRYANEESSSSHYYYKISEDQKDLTSLDNYSENKDDIITEEFQNIDNSKIKSNQENNNLNEIEESKNIITPTERISNKLTKEMTTKITTFKIIKRKKIRIYEMRKQYIKSFLGKLQHFIIKLMEIFNNQKQNEKDKILPFYMFQNCNIFIKYSTLETYKYFCLEKKVYEILKINDEKGKNADNIKTIDIIMNAVGEKRSEELNEVLNKPIKELMDIYRDKIKPEKGFYTHFKRFQNYLNELRQEKGADPKQIAIIEEQGMNYEIILKNIIDHDCKPGPKNKK